MSLLRTIWDELYSMFVDDGRYAAAILIWLAAAAAVLPRLGLPSALPPVLLFAGLAGILLNGALRRARRK